jgi:hypothetical protein
VATTLTRNLKLRVDSNLTANSKYNLERIDLLGGTFLTDSTNTLNIRSQTNLVLEPNSADLGGSGVGGTVSIGTPSHDVDTLNVYATNFVLSTNLGLTDQATGGNKDLLLRYKSDLNGAVDTAADRTLSVDLDGADRNLVLGGSLSLLGGDLTLTLSGTTSLTLPQSGTLSTLSGVETLTNKTLNASQNTITNLTNSSISASAAIQYSKLDLLGSITNTDIASAAGIQYSKLALTASIVDADVSGSAAIAYSKLSLANSVTNSDINSAAQIAYSKLNLASSITNSDIASGAAIARSKLAPGTPSTVVVNDGAGNLTETSALSTSLGGTGVSGSATYPATGLVLTDSNTASLSNKTISGLTNTLSDIAYASLSLSNSILNADIAAAAGIAYSKLNLSGSLVNSDVSPSAAIAGTKISPDFGNQTIRTLDKLEFEEGGYTTSIQAATGGQSTDLSFKLPSDYGINGQVLQTNGSGELAWITSSGSGTVTSVDLAVPAEFTLSGNPITTAGTITVGKANQLANLVYAGPSSGGAAQPSFRSLTVSDLPANVALQATGVWAAADGTTKVFTHSLGTSNVEVSFIDLSDNTVIYIGSVVITDSNTVTLTASEAPATNWQIIVQGR